MEQLEPRGEQGVREKHDKRSGYRPTGHGMRLVGFVSLVPDEVEEEEETTHLGGDGPSVNPSLREIGHPL